MAGGKKEKASTSSGGLGRALVRNHNQMLLQSKEKGAALRRQQFRGAALPLESVTEVTDLEAVIELAEENARVYSVTNPNPALRLDQNTSLDSNGEALTEADRMKEEALHASSLRVPRRPPWSADMSVEELDANERKAFLAWRRTLARLEENEKLVLTPFEKNLDIWRQLWRVLERSDLLVMVVDARDPLFYRCPDLEAYALEIDEHKRTLVLVNKADLLPVSIRMKWAKYFQQQGILFVFWSAKIASSTLEGNKMSNTWTEPIHSQESLPVDMDTKIYHRDELLARLQAEAVAIACRRESNKNILQADNLLSVKGNSEFKQVVVGFVGYPNVGKSSTINALVGEKRTGVTSTPGKTKHFQTLIISDKLILCDCPGLVFPSFSSSRYEMIASGVLPIDRMTENREAVQVVANRVPRNVLEGIYNITLPKPKPYEPQSRPPLASELLMSYCSSRGYVGSSGLPDETRAARQILKDYLDGKIPHFEMPPGMLAEEDAPPDGLPNSDYSESDSFASSDEQQCAAENPKINGDVSLKPDMDLLLNDLELFDIASGDSKTKAEAKKSAASHKHHRKPQRKKDRAWRVKNDGGDGMPVVRVFQKPAVNIASMKSLA